jgi:hypothetical protein
MESPAATSITLASFESAEVSADPAWSALPEEPPVA